MVVNNSFWGLAETDNKDAASNLLRRLGDLERKAGQMASIRPDESNVKAAELLRQCISITRAKVQTITADESSTSTATPRFS